MKHITLLHSTGTQTIKIFQLPLLDAWLPMSRQIPADAPSLHIVSQVLNLHIEKFFQDFHTYILVLLVLFTMTAFPLWSTLCSNPK